MKQKRIIVIFDMDGTLIDSSIDITASINYVRNLHYNLEPLSEQFVIDIINAPLRNLAKEFYNTEHYADRDRALFEEHYALECVKNVFLYDGIAQMLQTLHSNGVYLGVATNAPTMFAKIMLKHLEVDHYFSNIFGVEEYAHSKPNPYMLLKHLELANALQGDENSFMVGDNSKDIAAAKNASMNSIFVTWGFSSEGEGDYIATSPLQLVDIVLNNFKEV